MSSLSPITTPITTPINTTVNTTIITPDMPKIHILVINLDRRQDRWSSFQQHVGELKEQGKLQFVSSITRVAAEDILHAPGHGCALSHAKCIQMAQEQKWEYVMVVEDDVRWKNNCDDIFQNMWLDLCSLEWGIVFGGCVSLKRNAVFRCGKPSLLRIKPNSIFTGTHCMLYHSQVYTSVLNVLHQEYRQDNPLAYPIDMLLCHTIAPSLIYLAVPYLALFVSVGVSDVRKGKDTSNDFTQLVQSETLAKELVLM